MTQAMEGSDDISINMPCASMPVSAEEAPAFVHPKLVTYLTGFQQYFSKGELIPHLIRKGFFCKSQPTAINHAVLLANLQDTLTSWTRWSVDIFHLIHESIIYNGVTGLHNSLGPDCTLSLSRMSNVGSGKMGLPRRQLHQPHHRAELAHQC